MKTAIVVLAIVACAFAKPQNKFDNKAIAGGLLCGVCEDLVKGAEGMGAAEAESYLDKEIQAACHNLGFLSSICTEELEKVVKDLVTYIEQGLSPHACCQKVDLC